MIDNPEPAARRDIHPIAPTALPPFAAAFFLRALRTQALAHAYLLKGNSAGMSYRLALALGKVLNCRNPVSPEKAETLEAMACGQCTDCRWAERNAHPALMTVSRLTYLVGDKGEDLSPEALEKLAKKASQPTQIKAEQVERLLAQLAMSTVQTRVVIFADADVLPADMASGDVDVTPPYEWAALEGNRDKRFVMRPLTRKLFNVASANRFLKTLEEPPPGTLFFFIAETEEQLLDTIVSRCQVLPSAAGESANQAASSSPPDGAGQEPGVFFEELLAGFSTGNDVYGLLDVWETFCKERELRAEQALGYFQAHLRTVYASRLTEEGMLQQYRLVQKAVQVAIERLKAKVHATQTVLDLFLRLSAALSA